MKNYWNLSKYISNKLFLNMDFKKNREFEFKYIEHSIQRGKLLNWIIFFLSLCSFYLDINFHNDNSIDITYRKTLMILHITSFLLSFLFIIIYNLLEKSSKYKYSKLTESVILSDMFLTILTASLLSLNSQRYMGNIDAYILINLAVALVIPIYPKWVVGLYSLNHTLFLIGLSVICNDSSEIIKQFNSTTTVIVSISLFLILYNYNVKSFLYEVILKEEKINFTKLFEITPFPLLISRFEDGKIYYANQKAMSFYGIEKDKLDSLYLKQFYVNNSDLNIVHEMITANKSLNDFMSEHKTLSGEIKYTIINYELIDYFGKKCILSGITDISEIKRVNKDFTKHATLDELTGVLNRRVGMELLKRRFEMCRDKNEEFNICFLDIDNLKVVNDKFGHLEGDSLITEVCQVIKEEIKNNDIIFRYGGDEFVILFNDSSEIDINNICRRIEKRFDTLNENNHKPYDINESWKATSDKLYYRKIKSIFR